MASWSNHAAIAAPRNGTTSHMLVSPSTGTLVAGAYFTPTAGRLLVCVVEGAVTSSLSSGWTQPTGGSAVGSTGLYVWWRQSTMGMDTIGTTHNGSNFPVVFDWFEFPAGSTFVAATSAINVANSSSGPTLSGLTGTNHLFGALGQDNSGATTQTVTWTTGTKQVDTSTPLASATDGYTYSLTCTPDSTATSVSFAGSSTSGINLERLVFAVNIVAGSATPVAQPPVIVRTQAIVRASRW